MMQVAIAVAAGLLLAGFVGGCGGASPSLLKPSPAPPSKFEVAGDGVDAPLPSAQAPPGSSYGTPIAMAGPMPSATKFTHNMFEP